jgi:hypothetical protein
MPQDQRLTVNASHASDPSGGPAAPADRLALDLSGLEGGEDPAVYGERAFERLDFGGVATPGVVAEVRVLDQARAANVLQHIESWDRGGSANFIPPRAVITQSNQAAASLFCRCPAAGGS